MLKKTFNPQGKTFKQRLSAFLDAAKKNHSVTISQDNGRDKKWSQKHHVAHMFLYNKYKSSKPVNRESGKKTISWSHFSNAQILWGTIKFSDLLRTASNTIPVKKDNGWKKGYEPDEAATKRYIKAMMLKSNIGSSGTAMVAPGVSPCGQPCKCGATKSKHLTGVAADLSTTALKSLTTKLKAANAGDLDTYLKTFGLHRPLLNHKSSPEPWHVEATK